MSRKPSYPLRCYSPYQASLNHTLCVAYATYAPHTFLFHGSLRHEHRMFPNMTREWVAMHSSDVDRGLGASAPLSKVDSNCRRDSGGGGSGGSGGSGRLN